MKKRNLITIAIIVVVITFLIILLNINSSILQGKVTEGNPVILYQFYGEGCPHCFTEQKFLEEAQQKYPSLEVKTYEIYLNQKNRELFEQMARSFGTEIQGVPTIFLDEKVIVGYSPSLGNKIETEIQRCLKEQCIDAIDKANHEEVTHIIGESSPAENPQGQEKETLTMAKIVSLAIVDAVNPCALAVLMLMLIAILTYNPRNKTKLLLAGLAFTLSVFIMYFIYGLIIIKFFQVIQALTTVRLFLYKTLGAVAIVIGALNIKDFFYYKKGCIGTEMPIFLRPKVKKIISKVTSPSGAFIVGLFVTIFLLPCTIGPYIIAGGILSAMVIIKTIPPLLLYNAIFVMPMIIITGIVYFGISKVEDVSGWKDKNIKVLHLIAGIIMLLLGIGLLMGWL